MRCLTGLDLKLQLPVEEEEEEGAGENEEHHAGEKGVPRGQVGEARDDEIDQPEDQRQPGEDRNAR